jgi:hypothetical protein
MSSWLANFWWMLWAFVAVAGLITYRIRRRGGDEPLLRRIEYALFPSTDPAYKPQRQLSALAIILIGGGLLLIMFVNLFLLH